MAAVNLKSMIDKLNPPCLDAFKKAIELTNRRRQYEVEVEHWLLYLLDIPNGDWSKILPKYEADPERVRKELNRAIEHHKAGNQQKPEISLEVMDLLQESWLLTSLEFGSGKLRSGYLLTTLLVERALLARLEASVPELAKIPGERLKRELTGLLPGSAEDAFGAAPAAGAAAGPGQPAVAADSKTPALDQYTINLTQRAKEKKIDPVIGRDFEIRQVIDILTRRRQNNPILTGEAGVGKTAVVEGFALRVAAGDVPEPLKPAVVRTLDLGLLQAGAGVKGEFENRLKSVIAEVKASPIPIILFIDEAHTVVGAGGQAGQNDAANLLKPALARGELRTIAATTWMEYKKYFETDAALKRRFQVIKVDEPDVDRGLKMLRGTVETLEKHHKVRILDEAVADAVNLSHRYITDRQLPDKAISLLDTACARVALSQSATPAAVEECQREIEHLDVELAILKRESASGADHAERNAELTAQKAKAVERLAVLEKQRDRERELVDKIRTLREDLEGGKKPAIDPKVELDKLEARKKELAQRLAMGDDVFDELQAVNTQIKNPPKPKVYDSEPLKAELRKLETQLKEIQGETPLVFPVVNGQAVAEVVSGWTGIPLGKMVRDEIKTVLHLADLMKQRIIGQDHALEAVAQRIKTARANLVDPRRPIGVFLLVGPSGVGKTETALALADILYGGDKAMVVINMSEYKEEHKISRLTGSAAGYVGYGEGGVLTESVRRRPYSVVLLDEVEKANVAVQEIFYQVFDKGVLQDDKGNDVDFKNTIILLTSNVGTDVIHKLCADPTTAPDAQGLAEALRPSLLKAFKPALLGRLTVVPYFQLSDEVLRKIITLNLQRIGERMELNHKAKFTYDDALVASVASRCKEVESGARNVDHIITGTLLPELSRQFLEKMAEGAQVTKAHVGVDANGQFTYAIS